MSIRVPSTKLGAGRFNLLSISALLLTAFGCKDAPMPPPPLGAPQTLRLSQDQNGALDCEPPATCENLPYDGECATLEIDVFGDTGRVCQRCYQADGTLIAEGCDDTSVACVLVTLPDPDCVVCAYVDGSVIYSTCTSSAPNECFSYARSDGLVCEQCVDETGRIITDNCLPDCSNVACPEIGCAPGFELQRSSGECCPQCVPIDRCDEFVCEQDFTVIPTCDDGMVLRRDPVDCCTYYCEPTECPQRTNDLPQCAMDSNCPPDLFCIDGMCMNRVECPPGYVWVEDYPYCGQCLSTTTDERTCTTSAECFEGEYCAFDDGLCGSSGATDPACLGICRPTDPVCDGTGSSGSIPCEGEWVVEYDESGCPYPICICFNGFVSLDGFCNEDPCATETCGEIARCDTGYHAEFFFPYCCGICVPDDPCTNPDDPTGVLVCPEVICAPGYYEELDPDTCCPTCVPDPIRPCVTDTDCFPNELCVGGECAAFVTPTAICTDTDGGIEPAVFGEVRYDSLDAGGIAIDTCTNDGLAVVEYYCYDTPDGDSYLDAIVVECVAAGATSACIDGACVQP